MIKFSHYFYCGFMRQSRKYQIGHFRNFRNLIINKFKLNNLPQRRKKLRNRYSNMLTRGYRRQLNLRMTGKNSHQLNSGVTTRSDNRHSHFHHNFLLIRNAGNKKRETVFAASLCCKFFSYQIRFNVSRTGSELGRHVGRIFYAP